jgi:hypothetical protein
MSSPEPNVTPWHTVGDILEQGGTVDVSEVKKLNEQFGKDNGGSKKGKS